MFLVPDSEMIIFLGCHSSVEIKRLNNLATIIYFDIKSQ